MSHSRDWVVVARALPCDTVPAPPNVRPACTATALSAGKTIPVGVAVAWNNGNPLATAHRPLPAPPGEIFPVSIPTRSTHGG